jgi:hypothetical protein
MKRWPYSLFSDTTALSFVALSLVSDPIAFVAGGSKLGGIAAHAQTAPTPLSANDVSWLFPAPKSLDEAISMADLKARGKPVWSDAAFSQLLIIVNSPAGHVAGTHRRIELPKAVRSKGAWYIAAVRFDPSAPGFSEEIRDQFGRELQIRLVVQPVTRERDRTIKVHDIAVHLIFEFNTGIHLKEDGCLPRPQPDVALTKKVVQELVKLRAKAGEEATSGKPLGVHPGLSHSATAGNVRKAMKELLEQYLSDQHLGFMTITAVQEDPPGHEDVTKRWIFMGMINLKLHPEVSPHSPKSGFVALAAPALDGQQYAQMFSENNTLQNRVVPTPYANNGSHLAITCRNAANPVAGSPIDRRFGYTTSDIMNKRRLIDLPPPNELHNPDNPQNKAIKNVLNTIADPDRSHVFNTDCVSCHTETRLWQDLLNVDRIPGINPCVLPNDNRYNMRAFGWAPQHFEDPKREIVRPTVTRRTANETAKVVDFVNQMLLSKSAIAPMPNELRDAIVDDCK